MISGSIPAPLSRQYSTTLTRSLLAVAYMMDGSEGKIEGFVFFS